MEQVEGNILISFRCKHHLTFSAVDTISFVLEFFSE